MGDGALMEFSSVVDAVQFAVEVQVAVAERNSELPENRRIVYRMGINIGDIIVEGDDIHGDGVNVAARLEGLSEPGGVCLARNVFNQVKGKLDLSFEHLGEKEVKNIAEPVTVYRVVLDEKAAALVTPLVKQAPDRRRSRWALAGAGIAMCAFVVAGGVYWHTQVPEFSPADPGKMAYPLPSKPSIAVLPFANLGNDPEQEYLADGITNDLITDLSKFNSVFVIAANSVFTYKGKPVKVQDVAQDLGVQYVLEGSVQRGGDTLRVNAQLIDALTGHHIWADRYDRAADQFFVIQDNIIGEIVANLALRVSETERERASRKGTENLTAYDYFLRASAREETGSKEDNHEAIRLLEKALEIDPGYAQALALLARVHLNLAAFGWAENKEEANRIAREIGKKGVRTGTR